MLQFEVLFDALVQFACKVVGPKISVEVVEVVDALVDEHVEELVDAHEAGAAACDLVGERF